MNSLNAHPLESNRKTRINFDGGDLSSDSGLLLIHEFAEKIGFHKVIKSLLRTTDKAFRRHTDDKNLAQMLYQIIGGYHNENHATELKCDPVYQNILDKRNLASQPTLSRFWNRMDETTLQQFDEISKQLRRIVYRLNKPTQILLDLDSTLLKTHGNQEGEGFNYHYSAHGYHPLMCFDGLTGELLKAELRPGTVYSSNGVVEFLQPLLNEYLEDYSETSLFLRGDSGFATPDLFKQCESNGVSYAIRLKANQNLYKKAKVAEDRLLERTRDNVMDYAVEYDSFMYKASSWDYPRRVVLKIEKPVNQFAFQHAFIVTNMDLPPRDILRFYCNRGTMENFIKECKNGFDFSHVSSQSMVVNANKLQVHMLAYNLLNWFRQIVLPESMRKMQVDTIRLKLFKIASKVIRSARYVYFKLCSSCPYKKEFYETLRRIQGIPLLE